MSRLNYKTIYAITLREYDDKPAYNVTFKDNKGETVTEEDIRRIHIKKRLDYDVTEFMLMYFHPRDGALGIEYTYVDSEQEYLDLEKIIFTDNSTGEQYNHTEIEEIMDNEKIQLDNGIWIQKEQYYQEYGKED